MKKAAFAALVFLVTYTVSAQSFGIKGGINFSNLNASDDGNFKSLTSFHIGILKEFVILENFTLQPELLYSTQGAQVKNSDDNYKLNYILLPVLAKVYLNDVFNIHAGPQFGLLLGETNDVTPIESKTFDFGIAAGFEYELTSGISFTGRYIWGQTSMADNADLKNSAIQLSLGFLF